MAGIIRTVLPNAVHTFGRILIQKTAPSFLFEHETSGSLSSVAQRRPFLLFWGRGPL